MTLHCRMIGPETQSLGAPMPIDPIRHVFYQSISSCPLRCRGVTNDPEAGIIPRSYFWTDSSSKRVSLLIVSKNPAPAPDWETARHRSAGNKDIVALHLSVGQDLFDGSETNSSRYNINLIRRVAGVLGVVPSVQAVFRQAAMTALVKCQSSGRPTDRLHESTISTCMTRHLMREIAHYNPAYLLALGKESFDFLTKPEIQRQHGRAVGKLYHPSWSNMRGGEKAYFEREIPQLRQHYEAALRQHQDIEADLGQ